MDPDDDDLLNEEFVYKCFDDCPTARIAQWQSISFVMKRPVVRPRVRAGIRSNFLQQLLILLCHEKRTVAHW